MRLARRSGDLLGLGAVLLLVGKLTSGIGHVRDLAGADEATYGTTGLRLLASLRAHVRVEWPEPDWSPLYSLWYAALGALLPDRERLFDVEWSLLVALATMGLYVLSRMLRQSVTAAVAIAAAPLATSFFHTVTYVSHFYLVVLLAGCSIACACRTRHVRVGVLVATLGCAAFVRPEAALAFLACTAATALSIAFGPNVARALWRALPAFALPGALLLVFGNPLAGARGFGAFSQHYAFALTRREHGSGDPWMNYEAIVRRDFGDAGSIRQALAANPSAVLSHAIYNLRELPGNVLDLFALRRSVTVPSSVPWQTASAVLVAIAAIALIARWRSGAAGTTATTLVGRTFALACVAAAPAVVLVFPRTHYLVAPCAFGWLLAGTWLADVLRRSRWGRAMPRAVVFVGTLATLWWAVPSPATSVAAPQPMRRAVLALRSLHLGDAPVLAADDDLMTMAGYDDPVWSGWWKSEPLFSVIVREGIGIITLQEAVRWRSTFADDPDVAALLGAPGRSGFCAVYEAPGFVRVLARPQLLSAEQRERLCN
jgi:hypothetical protein